MVPGLFTVDKSIREKSKESDTNLFKLVFTLTNQRSVSHFSFLGMGVIPDPPNPNLIHALFGLGTREIFGTGGGERWKLHKKVGDREKVRG